MDPTTPATDPAFDLVSLVGMGAPLLVSLLTRLVYELPARWRAIAAGVIALALDAGVQLLTDAHVAPGTITAMGGLGLLFREGYHETLGAKGREQRKLGQ